MNNKLKQAAEAYAEQQYPQSEYPHSNFRKKLIDDLAGDLMTFANSPAAKEYWQEQGWISVKDELPADNKVVITFSQNSRVKKISFGWWNEYHKCWLYYGQKKSSVTHWRFLPVPPKTT